MTSGGSSNYGYSYSDSYGDSNESNDDQGKPRSRSSRSCGCRPPGSNDVDECEDDTFHQCLFTRITISVGITMPNHIGLFVGYKICFDDTTCKKGAISVFGNPGTQKNSQISSEHFSIREDTVRKHP